MRVIVAVVLLCFMSWPLNVGSTSVEAWPQTMLTSWYGPGFHGRRTASGEIFNQNRLTAAHKKLPFGKMLHLVNPDNGRYVIVRINDRGPYWEDRELDISKAAARELGMIRPGVAELRYFVLDPAYQIKPPEVVFQNSVAD